VPPKQSGRIEVELAQQLDKTLTARQWAITLPEAIVKIIEQPSATARSIAKPRNRYGLPSASDAENATQLVDHYLITLDAIADQHRITREWRANSCAVGIEQPGDQRL